MTHSFDGPFLSLTVFPSNSFEQLEMKNSYYLCSYKWHGMWLTILTQNDIIIIKKKIGKYYWFSYLTWRGWQRRLWRRRRSGQAGGGRPGAAQRALPPHNQGAAVRDLGPGGRPLGPPRLCCRVGRREAPRASPEVQTAGIPAHVLCYGISARVRGQGDTSPTCPELHQEAASATHTSRTQCRRRTGKAGRRKERAQRARPCPSPGCEGLPCPSVAVPAKHPVPPLQPNFGAPAAPLGPEAWTPEGTGSWELVSPGRSLLSQGGASA